LNAIKRTLQNDGFLLEGVHNARGMAEGDARREKAGCPWCRSTWNVFWLPENSGGTLESRKCFVFSIVYGTVLNSEVMMW